MAEGRLPSGQRQQGIDRQGQHPEPRGKQRCIADSMDRREWVGIRRINWRDSGLGRSAGIGRHRNDETPRLGLAVSHECEKAQTLDHGQADGAIDTRGQGEPQHPDVLKRRLVQLRFPVTLLPFHRLPSAPLRKGPLSVA